MDPDEVERRLRRGEQVTTTTSVTSHCQSQADTTTLDNLPPGPDGKRHDLPAPLPRVPRLRGGWKRAKAI